MKKSALKILLPLMLCVCAVLALPGLSAAAENVGIFTVGQGIGSVRFYQSALPIENCELNSGGLVQGIQMTWDEAGVYITGTPQNTGSYIAEYIVYTGEGAAYATVSFTVNPAPTPAPTPTKTPGNPPGVTKHPTGETVEAGGAAKFIARADNADRIVWRLVSPDASDTYTCADAPDYFRGLEVSGLGTDTLLLEHIIPALDGWYVEAKFENAYGYTCSNGAKLTVLTKDAPATPKPAPAQTAAPTIEVPAPGEPSGIDLPVDDSIRTANISVQPVGKELKPGDNYTLSVVATSPNNGSLSYQWYNAATDNFNAALPISGASDASYTVSQTDGTVYYWVAVWNAKEGSRSQPVYSDPAAVTIVHEPVATPTPVPTPEPTATRRGAGASGVNFQLVLFSVIGLVALAALIGVVIYLRIDARRKGGDGES